MSERETADLSDKAALFAISPTALWTDEWAAVGLLGAGLLISTIWFLITIHGWLLLQRHAEMASSFAMTHFRHLPNPFT